MTGFELRNRKRPLYHHNHFPMISSKSRVIFCQILNKVAKSGHTACNGKAAKKFYPVKVLGQKLTVHVPVGMVVGHPLVLHEAREAFVQPEIVPPRQRDQIAEPPEMERKHCNWK